eukprot:790767-Pyramimonas_sp.AAC.1
MAQEAARGPKQAPRRPQYTLKRLQGGPKESLPTTAGLHVLQTCTPRSERNPRLEGTCCRRQVCGGDNTTCPVNT